MMCLDQELLMEPNQPIYAFLPWAFAFAFSLPSAFGISLMMCFNYR